LFVMQTLEDEQYLVI